MVPNLIPIFSLTFKQMRALFAANNLTEASARIVFNWHPKKRQNIICEHHNLPRATRAFVAERFDYRQPTLDLAQESADRTVKFLFRLFDGKLVETVLIPFQGKYSVCLSSQVGCAMKCDFCHTGEQGFLRHLLVEEIVGQVRGVQEWLSLKHPGDDYISNLVYMGQGEPLHNFSAVATSAEIFISQHGLSFAGHKITVSTAGYLPGLKRWAREMPDVNIALSLHSADTDKRNQLIPINRRYPLAEVLPLVSAIPKGKKRFATFEVLLVADFNDAESDARRIGDLLIGRRALVNLIPFNPYPGARYKRPPRERVLRFKQILDEYGLPTMIRRTKGDDILAACGQLNSERVDKNCYTRELI